MEEMGSGAQDEAIRAAEGDTRDAGITSRSSNHHIHRCLAKGETSVGPVPKETVKPLSH